MNNSLAKYRILDNDTAGFNYQQFLNIDLIKNQSSIADNLGIPTLNRFVCLLNAPPKNSLLSDNGFLEFQVIRVDCPNIGIEPGSELELNGVRRFWFKGRNDADLSVTFLETPDLVLRRFFFAWMQLAVNVSSEGALRGYLEEYIAKEFLIFPLDQSGRGHYNDKFINIFPYDINSINYDYGRDNEIIETTVKFKYMFHYINKINQSDNYHWSTKEF